MKARKLGRLVRGSAARSGFNGAAPMKARKCEALPQRVVADLASMEPRR